jgi:hypothetical protein
MNYKGFKGQSDLGEGSGNPKGIAAHSPGLVLLAWDERDTVEAQPQRGCGQSELICEQPKVVALSSKLPEATTPLGLVRKPSGPVRHEGPKVAEYGNLGLIDATPLGLPIPESLAGPRQLVGFSLPASWARMKAADLSSVRFTK